MRTQSRDLFLPLAGLPHILFASGETIPNIVGMKELGAEGYVILCTKEKKPDRLREICGAFGFSELHAPIAIESLDARRTKEIVSQATARLRTISPPGWVWNFTPGTKQMFIGVHSALQGERGDGQCIKGSIYVDTRNGGMIALLDPPVTRQLSVRLSVHELLTAQGIFPMKNRRERASGLTFSIPGEKCYLTKPWSALARDLAEHLPIVKSELGSLRSGGSQGHHRNNVGNISYEQCRNFFARLRHDIRIPAEISKDDQALSSMPAFLNGKWLEVFIYSTVRELCEEGSVDDAKWGVVLYKWDSETGAYNINTDIDVCFSHRNNFRHISCKTEHPTSCRTEIFSIEARQRQLGGAFGRGMLVHWHNRMKAAQELADLFGIEIVGGKTLGRVDELKERIRAFAG